MCRGSRGSISSHPALPAQGSSSWAVLGGDSSRERRAGVPRCPRPTAACTRGTSTDTAPQPCRPVLAPAELGSRGEAGAGGGGWGSAGNSLLWAERSPTCCWCWRCQAGRTCGGSPAAGTAPVPRLVQLLLAALGCSPCSLGSQPPWECPPRLGKGSRHCSSVFAAQTQRWKRKAASCQPQKWHRFPCKPLGAALLIAKE